MGENRILIDNFYFNCTQKNFTTFPDKNNETESITKSLMCPSDDRVSENDSGNSTEAGSSLILTPLICGITMTTLAFLGQIIVFIVTWNDARLRRPHNYYIVSLALADFLISVISMPIWTAYSALGKSQLLDSATWS